MLGVLSSQIIILTSHELLERKWQLILCNKLHFLNALKKVHWKLNLHFLLLLLIFFIAIFMRIYLAYHDWPLPNSDEGVMGVMAINILKYGEHPVVFYGQDYMGVLQAYLGAAIFQFLGVSVFGLRLGMIVLYTA